MMKDFGRMAQALSLMQPVADKQNPLSRTLEPGMGLTEGGRSYAGTAGRQINPLDIHDSHGGEMFGSKTITEDGKIKAAADVSMYGDTIYLNMVGVHPSVRRQGYATDLIKDLMREYPDYKIKTTNTTPEGSALLAGRFNVDPDGYIKPK